MANRIAPTAKQKSTFLVHVVVFIIVNAILWFTYDKGAMRVDVQGWAYPWPSWITAAWALSLIGHWAAIYVNSEDAGNEDYLRQRSN